ncbi:MAG: metallophosphoesterase [Clostridia bacterium]|nr:metallophosphoesterase [Clostridia bacterium]
MPVPKHKLQFRADGTFHVLMMSDLQESAAYDPRSLRSVEILLDECQPDLVILGGDNCYGPEIANAQELKAFLDIFTAPMESRKIPWAHVFGNHDHDVEIPIAEQQALYENYAMCVSQHTDDSVHGKSNFMLPIYNRKGEIALAVWGLDTNHHISELDGLLGGNAEEAIRLPNMPVGYGHWGMLYFDQLVWYWNTSRALEAEVGKKVPGLLCMHVAPYEYRTVLANPESCVASGAYGEDLVGTPFNTGLFSMLLQRGDIRGICCGHTHNNDFDAEYCGIRMFCDACVGYRCYGVDERRGGRLFTYHEDQPEAIESRMVRTFAKITAEQNV